AACAFSSSVAETEQDKTTLQRVVMNRAWPKPSTGVSGLTAPSISFHRWSRKLAAGQDPAGLERFER
ncbi:MAG: hypothetical protein DMF32_00675, partial [Verrucomicrobia bacterium]